MSRYEHIYTCKRRRRLNSEGKKSKIYLAVTLANIRHVTDVVINECKTSQRQTIKAKIKPINVEDHALKCT